MMTRNSHNALEHDDVLTLLPWHVNGQLESSEDRAVREHLDACATCQIKAQEMRTILSVAGDVGCDVDERRLGALMNRIDAHERDAANDAPMAARPGAWLRRLRAALSMRTVMLPAAGLAAALVVALVFIPASTPPESGDYLVHGTDSAVSTGGPAITITLATVADAQLTALFARYDVQITSVADAPATLRAQFAKQTDVAVLSAFVNELESHAGVANVAVVSIPD